jgi:hypothetical protein
MKTIIENNGLSIIQLEERFEMVVASKGSSDETVTDGTTIKVG